MSGSFSFPPPPPPPPRQSNSYLQHGQSERGRGRGRGRDGPPRGSGRYDGRSRSHQHGPEPYHHQRQHLDSSNLPQGYIDRGFAQSSAKSSSIYHEDTRTEPTRTTGSLPERSFPEVGPGRTVAGHKRKLEALRPPSREKRPGPETAPAVPSFGLPLNVSTLPSTTTVRNGAAQSRSKNLGLVPVSLEVNYSDSDASDDGDKDVDEEVEYAALGDKLLFEHNGTVMSLNTTADLEAWKRERKRNWPTRERLSERELLRRETGRERRRLLEEAAQLDQPQSCSQWPVAGKRQPPDGDASRSAQLNKERAGASLEPRSEDSNVSEMKPDESGQTELQKTQALVDQRTKDLEVLRSRVAESQAKARARKEELEISRNVEHEQVAGETGLDADLDHINPVHSSATNADQPPTASSEDSAPSSDTSSEVSSDSDSGPEEASTKQPTLPAGSADRPICRYFAASGYCRDGDACRFKHALPARGSRSNMPASQQRPRAPQGPRLEPMPGGKKGIYERLVEREQEEENKLALEVIKYLGGAGFFKAQQVTRADYHEMQ